MPRLRDEQGIVILTEHYILMTTMIGHGRVPFP